MFYIILRPLQSQQYLSSVTLGIVEEEQGGHRGHQHVRAARGRAFPH